MINSTLTANSATQFGGTIAAISGSGVSVPSNTITGNTANFDRRPDRRGGGIYNDAVVSVQNTILAGNMVGAGGGPNGQCRGDFISSEYNLRSAADAACNGFTGGNLVDPGLGTLSSNGGPNQTIPLLASSPAIDAGNPEPLAADPCPDHRPARAAALRRRRPLRHRRLRGSGPATAGDRRWNDFRTRHGSPHNDDASLQPEEGDQALQEEVPEAQQ